MCLEGNHIVNQKVKSRQVIDQDHCAFQEEIKEG